MLFTFNLVLFNVCCQPFAALYIGLKETIGLSVHRICLFQNLDWTKNEFSLYRICLKHAASFSKTLARNDFKGAY